MQGAALLGRPLSRICFVDDPLSKPKTMHKFQDQMWQLAIHVRRATRALGTNSTGRGTI